MKFKFFNFLSVYCKILLVIVLLLNPGPLIFAEDFVQSPATSSIKAEPPAPVDLKTIYLDVDYKEADLSVVLRALAYTYGLNLVTTKSLSGTVTITLTNVSLNEALEAMLSTNGYTYLQKGSIIYVLEGPDMTTVGMTTEAISLNFLLAEDAVGYLGKAVSGKGEIKALEATNSLLITDYPSFIDKVNSVLKQIDIAPIQVIIEAKVVDVRTQDIESFGAQFALTYQPVGMGKGLFDVRQPSSANDGTRESITGTVDLASAVGTTLDALITGASLNLKGFSLTNVQINALIEDSHTNLLASPSIATLNGQEAKIVIGERYPYTEKTQTTTGTTETTKFVDIGTILTVTPFVNPQGYVTMDVHPEVSSFDEAVADVGPRITTREATATIRVKNGQTIAIGGLITHDDSKTVDRIPFLGSLPFVGYLFSNRNKDFDKRELVIFLTPHIIEFGAKPKEIDYADSKEVFVNIEGVGEKVLVSKLMQMATNLESGDGLNAKSKTEKARMAEAAEIYRQISSQFPHSKEAPHALSRAASIYAGYFKEYRTAEMLAKMTLERYPENAYYVSEAQRMIQRCNKRLKWDQTKKDRTSEWLKKENLKEDKDKKGTAIEPKKKSIPEKAAPEPKVKEKVKKEYKPLFDFRKKKKEEPK